MATQKQLLDQDKAYQATVAAASGAFPTVAKATDGAIITKGFAVLTKTSAGAYTLAAPAIGANGQQLVITAGTAFAHVVTATNLIQDGVTGGAKDTLTFAAFVGASIHLVAYNQTWYVVAKNLVTVAAV